MIKGVNILDKYNEIWEKIKETFSIKFHSMSIFDQRYIKTKVREFDGKIKQTFQAMKYQNEICIILELPV